MIVRMLPTSKLNIQNKNHCFFFSVFSFTNLYKLPLLGARTTSSICLYFEVFFTIIFFCWNNNNEINSFFLSQTLRLTHIWIVDFRTKWKMSMSNLFSWNLKIREKMVPALFNLICEIFVVCVCEWRLPTIRMVEVHLRNLSPGILINSQHWTPIIN